MMDGVVAVGGGRVRGRRRDGVFEFLAVPYGRPPVGPLRWRPPERPEAWTGVRDAVVPGPMAPQPAAAPLVPGDPVDQSEDCLHLSIWTPGLEPASRPVMVFLHGGGFTSGTAGNVLYRGAGLAAAGDIVVVTVNYRLGALGFLAHPALGTDGRIGGNWALLDQVAALRWVRDHVASFGGDPRNVTLFGESAGAMCVSTLLAMPSARGLFHRAIVESGPPYVHSKERATERAEAFARELGLDALERTALEGVPSSDLVAALRSLARKPPLPGELPQPLIPVVDGSTLREHPLAAVAGGTAARVPLVVGTNRDEMTFFALTDPSIAAMDDAGLRRRVERSVPPGTAEAIVETYRSAMTRRGEPATPRDVWIAIGTDAVFRWPSLRLAAAACHGAPTFVYLFSWRSPAFDGVLGATHALELPFVFGTHREPGIARYAGTGDAADRLCREVQTSWAAFARNGRLSNGVVGEWPTWQPEERATMVFRDETAVVHAPRNEELAVWELLHPLPGREGGVPVVAGADGGGASPPPPGTRRRS